MHTGAKQTDHNRNMGLSMVTVGLMGLWVCLGSGVHRLPFVAAAASSGIWRVPRTAPRSSDLPGHNGGARCSGDGRCRRVHDITLCHHAGFQFLGAPLCMSVCPQSQERAFWGRSVPLCSSHPPRTFGETHTRPSIPEEPPGPPLRTKVAPAVTQNNVRTVSFLHAMYMRPSR